MSFADKTCRACGKASELEDGSDLCSLFNPLDYKSEIEMVLEEFEIWNLNISRDDGLPQKICLNCFDSFCQIHNFRVICAEAQMNFCEMCTGLDIIINGEKTDEDLDCLEDYDCEQTVTVQEYYKFPGDQTWNEENPDPLEDVPLDSSENLITEQQENQDEQKEKESFDLEIKKFRCEFCMGFVSFDYQKELNKHCNEQHSCDLPYNCPKCDMRFDRLAKRNSHARCHYEKTLQCEKCGKKFRGDDKMMSEHIAYYHVDKDRECPICHQIFEKISLKRYYYHMNWHDDSKLLKCSFCDRKFIQNTHLAVHERKHTDQITHECGFCDKRFTNTIRLQRHTVLHQKNQITECPQCPKRFFSKMGMKLHNMKTHNPDKKSICCKICNITYKYAHNLTVHNYKKHDGPHPRAHVVKRTGKPITATNAALQALRRQKSTKREFIKPFECDKCDESFVLDIQLEKHKKKHEEYRPYKCNICTKAFKRDMHLKLHQDNIHFNKRPHKCSTCGAGFVQRSHLKDHIAIKHEEKKRFKCDFCPKRFGTTQTLKIHKIGHSNERPYTCAICNKSYKQLVVLRAHMNCCHHLKIQNESFLKVEDLGDMEISNEEIIP